MSTTWGTMSLERLLHKRFMANLILRNIIDNPVAMEYDSYHEKVAHFREQRRQINQAIYRKRHGEDGPPAQVIGMKPAQMKSRAER